MRGTHRLVASCTCPTGLGMEPTTQYVPLTGIEPMALQCEGWHYLLSHISEGYVFSI